MRSRGRTSKLGVLADKSSEDVKAELRLMPTSEETANAIASAVEYTLECKRQGMTDADVYRHIAAIPYLPPEPFLRRIVEHPA